MISTRFPGWARAMAAGVLALAGVVALDGCQTVSEPDAGGGAAAGAKPKEGGAADAAVDPAFLLSMSFAEAKQLSPQSIELPPSYRIAADEITVTSRMPDGTPRRVRAKGHVFLQIEFAEEISALGQEALVGGTEVILRGKPLLRRGRSVVEGLEDRTVFFIKGSQLRAIGLHRLTNKAGVTPAWHGSWRDGPNPLLPALSPEDVPRELRASPLLPPVSPDDLRRLRR